MLFKNSPWRRFCVKEMLQKISSQSRKISACRLDGCSERLQRFCGSWLSARIHRNNKSLQGNSCWLAIHWGVISIKPCRITRLPQKQTFRLKIGKIERNARSGSHKRREQREIQHSLLRILAIWVHIPSACERNCRVNVNRRKTDNRQSLSPGLSKQIGVNLTCSFPFYATSVVQLCPALSLPWLFMLRPAPFSLLKWKQTESLSQDVNKRPSSTSLGHHSVLTGVSPSWLQLPFNLQTIKESPLTLRCELSLQTLPVTFCSFLFHNVTQTHSCETSPESARKPVYLCPAVLPHHEGHLPVHDRRTEETVWERLPSIDFLLCLRRETVLPVQDCSLCSLRAVEPSSLLSMSCTQWWFILIFGRTRAAGTNLCLNLKEKNHRL